MSHLQLIPNGEQVFVDANGEPYALGTVGMYVPNTFTDKDTWQDRDHVALNLNPIDLDAAGRCVIWGEGAYRQILKDVNGNTIWDKITQVLDPGIVGIDGVATTTEVLEGVSTSKIVTPDALAALWEQGVTVASAATLSIGEGGFYHVSGVVTITDIDFAVDKAGREVILVFDGVLTLTHNATSLILPTGANIVTAAGDCCKVVSEGSDNVRVVWYQRKNGTALAAASSGALTLITETVTSGSAADVTFSSIPATYRDLEVRVRGRGTTAANEVGLQIQFNGDTGNNYNYTEAFIGATGNVGAVETLGAASVRIGVLPAANATAGYSGVAKAVIGDYRGTTFNKPVVAEGAYAVGNASNGTVCHPAGGVWRTVGTAINAIRVFPSAGNLVDNTVVSLYGRT